MTSDKIGDAALIATCQQAIRISGRLDALGDAIDSPAGDTLNARHSALLARAFRTPVHTLDGLKSLAAVMLDQFRPGTHFDDDAARRLCIRILEVQP